MSDLEPHIRDARPEDLVRIIELLAADQIGAQREVVSEPLAPEYYRAFEEIEADPRSRLLVLELDGIVTGTLQVNFLPGLSRRGAERAQIEAVRVAREARGAGLGRTLILHAFELARERGCALVQLTTDLRRQDAHRFYESLGFVHSHAGMKLALPPRGSDDAQDLSLYS